VSGARFSKRRWLRLTKELIDQAAYFYRGWLPDEHVDRMTKAQRARQWNRHYDFEEIGRIAIELHDALSCLRR
jgi:hypothetical protein